MGKLKEKINEIRFWYMSEGTFLKIKLHFLKQSIKTKIGSMVCEWRLSREYKLPFFYVRGEVNKLIKGGCK
jgi:hypothetical protein